LEPIEDQVCDSKSIIFAERWKHITRFIKEKQIIARIILLLVFIGLWQFASNYYNAELVLPSPLKTCLAFVSSITDGEVLQNLLITMQRIITGFGYAFTIGLPLGFLMGSSKTAMRLIDPIASSIRQVPIMAWVPLTIVWFGLGDGPTVFLIAMVGVFPIMLNTMAGVQNISKDYYDAARSMGANRRSILSHVVLPGSMPDILTGTRLAVSAGWMSVI